MDSAHTARRQSVWGVAIAVSRACRCIAPAPRATSLSNRCSAISRRCALRVLGVDPGLTRCGIGVVEGSPGRPCRLVAVEVVRTEPDADLADRLLRLDQRLAELLAEHRPDAVAVERVFSQHNVRTVMGTAQAGAVAVLAAARFGAPVRTYTPSEVKAAVTGSGQAGKKQMATMVTRLLRLDTAPRPADAADALALAICHVWRGAAQARLQAAARAASAAGAASRGGHR
ncbi:MAG: crossover junction endodeoxyribonuclease RuvC [Micromonosporaceae bacterium]|nr:crossover junction endodeoxyribonuclease RuvC [Micromonosporaceae bacterium]